MTDFRALCAELANELHSYKLAHPTHCRELLNRAQAALSQPEPQSMSGHPITPPPELVEQWNTEGRHQDYCTVTEYVVHHAAQWGGDQELEAVLHLCDEWLTAETIRRIRATRRPKSPSLKEQALEIVKLGQKNWQPLNEDWNTIRRALEALPND